MPTRPFNPGDFVELECKRGRFIVLGCTAGTDDLKDPGPVLTLRQLGFPGDEPFSLSAGFVTRAYRSGIRIPGWDRRESCLLPPEQREHPLETLDNI